MIYNSALVQSVATSRRLSRRRARRRVALAAVLERRTPIGRDGRERVWLDEDAEAIRRRLVVDGDSPDA